jgi:putative effector of murein hydrolase
VPAAALVRYLVVLAVALLAAVVGTVLVHRFASRWLALSQRASRALAGALASWVVALAVGRLGGQWLGDPAFAALAIAGTLGLVGTLAAAALFAIVAVTRKARGRTRARRRRVVGGHSSRALRPASR